MSPNSDTFRADKHSMCTRRRRTLSGLRVFTIRRNANAQMFVLSFFMTRIHINPSLDLSCTERIIHTAEDGFDGSNGFNPDLRADKCDREALHHLPAIILMCNLPRMSPIPVHDVTSYEGYFGSEEPYVYKDGIVLSTSCFGML